VGHARRRCGGGFVGVWRGGCPDARLAARAAPPRSPATRSSARGRGRRGKLRGRGERPPAAAAAQASSAAQLRAQKAPTERHGGARPHAWLLARGDARRPPRRGRAHQDGRQQQPSNGVGRRGWQRGQRHELQHRQEEWGQHVGWRAAGLNGAAERKPRGFVAGRCEWLSYLLRASRAP
jgi:hypothetical protein